jgi:hypothetical protein
MNQRADAGDHEDHHRRERVQPQRQVEREVTGRDPGIERLRDLPALGRQAHQREHLHHRDHKRQRHHRGGEAARHRFGQAPPQEGIDEEPDERQQWDER